MILFTLLFVDLQDIIKAFGKNSDSISQHRFNDCTVVRFYD